MSSDQSIGLMDGAYFVGRKEILDWINTTCGLNLSKVEQTCNGAIACQLLDAIYPGKIPMNRVDWGANKDYEYIQNYKILQKGFMKLKIDKHIEVDRLIRGKYQDNLEFMQWFKRFYELNASDVDYDPVSQREKGKGGTQYSNKFKGGESGGPKKRVGSSSSTRQTAAKTNSKTTNNPPAAPTRVVKSGTGSRTAPRAGSAKSATESTALLAKDEEIFELNTVNENLTNENGNLRSTIAGLEKERDFYFGKLRDIEIMLQGLEDHSENPMVKGIFKILYATEDEFVGESEDADVHPTSEPDLKSIVLSDEEPADETY